MFTLPAKKDGFRLLLPKEIIPEEIEEKYTNILTQTNSFYKKPIDFLNESIQKIQVLGFNGGTVAQGQTQRGKPIRTPSRTEENWLLHANTDINYRSVANPEALIDKTLNIDFRHTLGYVNYFLLFESFMYQYTRDTEYKPDLDYQFNIELYNERGSVYSRIVLFDPLIDGIDMLDFDYSQPLAQSGTFKVIFKYSSFDYQFINTDANTDLEEEIPYNDIINIAKSNQKKEEQKFNRYPYEPDSTTENDDKFNVEKNNRIDNAKTYIDEDENQISTTVSSIPDYLLDTAEGVDLPTKESPLTYTSNIGFTLHIEE